MNKPLDVSMNLPVNNHLTRLFEIVDEMRADTNQAQKDLHILRGCISQLSFVNKESDQQLNEYLASAISSMRSKWASEWDSQHAELYDGHKKLNKLITEHEDIELRRTELEEKVQSIEEMVGLVWTNWSQSEFVPFLYFFLLSK